MKAKGKAKNAKNAKNRRKALDTIVSEGHGNSLSISAIRQVAATK